MKDLNTELDKLATIKGGQKHMWLKQHQELVLEFHQEFGEEATKQTFHLTSTTLHNLMTSPINTRSFKLTKVDRALAQAEIVRTDIQELRQEVRSLKQLFERFQLSVGEQLIEKFFKPLLQKGIEIDSDLIIEEEDKLSLKDFDFKNPLLLKNSGKKKG